VICLGVDIKSASIKLSESAIFRGFHNKNVMAIKKITQKKPNISFVIYLG